MGWVIKGMLSSRISWEKSFRLEWRCDNRNEPSKIASIRLGFVYEALLRQETYLKDEIKDIAWFSMTDQEWPSAKRALEKWLEPENFNQNGDQIEKLTHIRNAIQKKLNGEYIKSICIFCFSAY